MNIKRLFYIYVISLFFKFTPVFAISISDTRVDIKVIIVMSIAVLFNFIAVCNKEKKHMILSFILNFNIEEIPYFFINVLRLFFIIGYYFFVIPIVIDFFIVIIYLIKNIIKEYKKNG